MFAYHTVFYDIRSLKVCKTTEMYLLTGPPNAPNRPFLLHRPQGAVPPTLGTTGINQP